MSMELISKLESKIADLEAQFKKNSDFIGSANAAMEKLVSDKTLANNECNMIHGAIQMAKGVLTELKGPEAPVAGALPCDAEAIVCSDK
jgi:chromosome segregation ATPase